MKFIFLALLLISATYADDYQPWEYEQYGPAKKLIDELDSIQLAVRAEQLAHDEDNAIKVENCGSEISYFNSQITESLNAYNNAQNALTDCTLALNTAQPDLYDTGKYIEEINANIVNLDNIRNGQAVAYARHDEQLTNAIEAVQGAYAIIDEFAAEEVEFAQVTKYMTLTYIHVVKAKQGAKMVEVLSALAQLSSKLDQEQVELIRKMFQDLEFNLHNTQTTQSNVENDRITKYGIDRRALIAVRDKLIITKGQLEVYVASLQTCIIDETNIWQKSSTKYWTNRREMESFSDSCQEYYTEYERATAARTTEINDIEALKRFIAEKANQFGQYGADKTEVAGGMHSNENYKDALMFIERHGLSKELKSKLDAKISFGTPLKRNLKRRK